MPAWHKIWWRPTHAGTLTTTDLVTDRVTTAVVDTSILNATEVVATTETVGTLTADSADVGSLTAGTLTCTGNATVSGGMIVNGNSAVAGELHVIGPGTFDGTITAEGFPHTLTGQYNAVSDGKTALFDYYVNPGFMDFNDAVANTTAGQHAVWCVPRDITVTKVEARSTSVGTGISVTFGLVYGADLGAVTTPVFSAGICNNSGYVRTGSTAVPAGSFLSMYFSGVNTAGTTYNSWIVTYY